MRMELLEMVQVAEGVGLADIEHKGFSDVLEASPLGSSDGAAAADGYPTDPLSFENIMKELGGLKACIAERATTDLALGKLLDCERLFLILMLLFILIRFMP
jgi:hypothetical protein